MNLKMKELEAIFDEMGFDPKTIRLPEADVIYALARTTNIVSRQLAKVYKRFGLSIASFNLLMLLKHGKAPDSFTQQALGRRLVVSPSDMTGLLDRLEKKGLVRRIPGKDRRSNLLQITPKGSKLLDDVWPHHVEVMTRLSRPITRADAARLAKALVRVREAAGV